MNLKAMVATSRFTFGARQGIFFAGFGVQKNREVFANRQVTQTDQLFRRAAHDHPVVVLHRQAEQGITNRTTHHVNFHGGSLTFPPTLQARCGLKP